MRTDPAADPGPSLSQNDVLTSFYFIFMGHRFRSDEENTLILLAEKPE
jgi:hypothetical protein